MELRFITTTLGMILLSSIAFAKSPMDKYLSTLKILENENGRYLETFEDVEIKFNPFQESNKPYPIVNTSTIPEGYVNKDTAKNYFKSFTDHAVLTDEETTFMDFINEHFYMPNSLEDETFRLMNFPVVYTVNNPGTNNYYLCMDSNYEYVNRFEKYSPDALSCISCKSLCGRECYGSHRYGSNNIYSNFKENLMDKADITGAEEVRNPKNFITINGKDRTPPQIEFPNTQQAKGNDGNNPNLKREICTTSDWYEMPDAVITDNLSEIISAKYTFGRINRCLTDGEKWEDSEDWENPENLKTVYNKKFNDIVFFYPIDGFVRYCIFAQDEANNLNPSVSNIVQDRPDICYGYKENENLGNTPSTAIDWPDKRPIAEIAEKGKDTGYLRIVDNDNPNIIIRVTNVETGEQMFFPPCLASQSLRINNSTMYKFLRGVSNEDEYNSFVENLGVDYNYKSIQEATFLKPYYTIYSIDDKTIKTEKENNYIRKLLLNKDIEFINQNVRIEDHFYSDTNSDGIKTSVIHKAGELGRRNGTFIDMVAMFENNRDFVFRTNVEYKLDVWTDDNVKWTNQENGEAISTAKVYHTGINNGIIRLDIPNQKDEVEQENLSQDAVIDPTKAINGEIYFKLRKETPHVYDFEVPEDIEKERFPSIYVEAQDYSGLFRKIRLYFRVNDRNLDVRVIENTKKNKL